MFVYPQAGGSGLVTHLYAAAGASGQGPTYSRGLQRRGVPREPGSAAPQQPGSAVATGGTALVCWST